PTGAHAQPDSTAEHCPPAHPPRSNTLELLPEKMFPGAWNQTGPSTLEQCARLAEVARDWTRLCAHCRRARAEKPALATSQADGRIRNYRAPEEFVLQPPTDWLPRPQNLRTPRHRFPCRSLDTGPPAKARTSARRSAQRRHSFRRYLPPAHSASEFFLCPGCPEYASPAVHPPGQKPPGAQAVRDAQPVLQPHPAPICLLETWRQFTPSSSVLITLDTQRTFLTSRSGGARHPGRRSSTETAAHPDQQSQNIQIRFAATGDEPVVVQITG